MLINANSLCSPMQSVTILALLIKSPKIVQSNAVFNDLVFISKIERRNMTYNSSAWDWLSILDNKRMLFSSSSSEKSSSTFPHKGQFKMREWWLCCTINTANRWKCLKTWQTCNWHSWFHHIAWACCWADCLQEGGMTGREGRRLETWNAQKWANAWDMPNRSLEACDLFKSHWLQTFENMKRLNESKDRKRQSLSKECKSKFKRISHTHCWCEKVHAKAM